MLTCKVVAAFVGWPFRGTMPGGLGVKIHYILCKPTFAHKGHAKAPMRTAK